MSVGAEEEYAYHQQQQQQQHHRYDAISPQSIPSAYPQQPQQQQQTPSGRHEVNEVGDNDVLCGRGAPTNYHQGNEYFRELVKEYQAQYLASKRADKPVLASHIVDIVHSRGGRFLRRYKRSGVSSFVGHFVWVEVDPQKAYEKACQALREGAPELRRRMKSSSTNSIATSSVDEDDASDAEQGTGKGKKNARTKKDGSLLTRRAGERMQESSEAEPTRKEEDTKLDSQEAAAAAKASFKRESNEDDRNDKMDDGERS